MTADIRTAAHHEAKARYGVGRDPVIRRMGFEDGAVWGANRVTPTREQIAAVLRKHKLIHVSVSRKSAFCACDPSVIAGVDDNRAWYEAHMADAVLALMQGLAEGESSG